MKNEQCEVMNQNNLELHLPRDKEQTFMYLADAKWLTDSKDMKLTGSYEFPYKVSIPFMNADRPNWKCVATLAMPSSCVRFPGNVITDVWVYMCITMSDALDNLNINQFATSHFFCNAIEQKSQ